MKIVLDQTKDIMLLIIGEGDLKNRIIQMVNELGLSSNILFDNFRLDIPDILNAVDIYCLPSLWEGLPIGILEAMSMGKVIIATPIDGTRELITNYENGILVPQQNPELLAKAIIEVHGNEKLRMKLAKSAIQTINERFTVNEMVKKIENHYKSIIKCNENRNRNSTTVP
jgi:glycosyltransferase involved in cell wall biosynthesis